MTTVCGIEDVPICLVTMEWESELEKGGLLSLMYMPHIGDTT